MRSRKNWIVAPSSDSTFDGKFPYQISALNAANEDRKQNKNFHGSLLLISWTQGAHKAKDSLEMTGIFEEVPPMVVEKQVSILVRCSVVT